MPHAKNYSQPKMGPGVASLARAEHRAQARREIEAKLRDPAVSWRSDQDIGRLVGCSKYLVEGVRRRLGLTEATRSSREKILRGLSTTQKKGERSHTSHGSRWAEERLRVANEVYLAQLLPVPCQCWRVAACLGVRCSETDDGRNRVRRAGFKGRPGKERR